MKTKMTESEWLTATEAWPMVVGIREMASDRKLRLAACGYCRLVWHLLERESRRAVVLGESLADNPDGSRRSTKVERSAIQAVMRAQMKADARRDETDRYFAADIAYRAPLNNGRYAAEWTIGNWTTVPGGVAVIREVFGNPFRPVAFDPAWRTPTVLAIAEAAYDDRAFDRLPILADAVQEAGCEDYDVLNHLRANDEHIRGCWALDLVLGKS